MRALPITLLSLLLAFATKADFLILRNGQVVFGEIQSTAVDGVRLKRGDQTNEYPNASFLHAYVTKDSATPSDALPSSDQLIDAAGKRDWAYSMKQIPATVIEKGPLKHVPYLSFRCGLDYELNIYGDPDHPACVEIGVYRSLLKDKAAAENCVGLFTTVFGTTPIGEQLGNLGRNQEVRRTNGWTIEITPPEGADSYGGWWVSVYSEEALGKSRASATELKAITETKDEIRMLKSKTLSWSLPDLGYSRPSAPIPSTAVKPAPTPANSSGSVYVRGYYRKDGTYVRPHTRRR